GWLAVAVSQSGRTPEITNVLKTLASDGARTLAITNGRDSPLAAAADWTLHLDAGDERAVPATKTFTAQLAAVALLAEALGDTAWPDDHWAAGVSAVRDVLQDDERPTARSRPVCPRRWPRCRPPCARSSSRSRCRWPAASTRTRPPG